MSLFSPSKKNITHYSLIFDIGSSTVAGGLVIFPADLEPCILYTKRVPMTYQSELNFERFLDVMLATLSLVVDDIVKNGYDLLKTVGSHPSKAQDVFCVFSSPWYISQTKIISLHEEKPLTISERFIDDLIKRSVEQFKGSDKAKQSLQVGSSAELIEQRIIEIKLNGYETINPYAKIANDIQIALYTSMISKGVKEKVAKTITERFHEKNIEFHSFALTMFSSIRDSYPKIRDYLIFDFGGEVTDVSIIRSGVLTQTVSIPFGSNVLIRKITQKLNTVPEEAISQITRYLKGDMHDSKTKVFDDMLVEIEAEWIALVGELLKGLSNDLPIPQTIFHTTSDDLNRLFVTFMNKDSFYTSAMAVNKFNLISLQSDSLNIFCTFTPHVTKDLFLGLEATFFDKTKLVQANQISTSLS